MDQHNPINQALTLSKDSLLSMRLLRKVGRHENLTLQFLGYSYTEGKEFIHLSDGNLRVNCIPSSGVRYELFSNEFHNTTTENSIVSATIIYNEDFYFVVRELKIINHKVDKIIGNPLSFVKLETLSFQNNLAPNIIP